MVKQPPELGKGLQNYFQDIDVKHPPYSLNSLEKAMLRIQNICHGSVLDVGCGNGRLNTVFQKYFNKIVGIDKFREPNPIYLCPNYEFRNCDIFGVNEKFDVIIFMGSFYLHYCYGYLETLLQVLKLLEYIGKIVIADDKVNKTPHLQNKPGYYDLEILCNGTELKISDSFIHEDYLLFTIIGNI